MLFIQFDDKSTIVPIYLVKISFESEFHKFDLIDQLVHQIVGCTFISNCVSSLIELSIDRAFLVDSRSVCSAYILDYKLRLI